MKKYTAVFLIVFFMVFPVLAQGQTGQSSDDYVQGRLDGEAAAKGDALWFAAGCFFGCLGVLAAYILSDASPPMSMLVGKSPTYISAYTEAFKAKKKIRDTTTAAIGMGVSAVTYLVLYFLVLASVSSSTYYY
jgi:hypothetical protein